MDRTLILFGPRYRGLTGEQGEGWCPMVGLRGNYRGVGRGYLMYTRLLGISLSKAIAILGSRIEWEVARAVIITDDAG